MGKGPTIPQNWPLNFPYLSQPSYSLHLTKPQHQAVKTRPPDLKNNFPSTLHKGPSPLVKISPIATPSHPAHGQSGLFAARHLPPDSLIVPYYGITHTTTEPHSSAHEKSDYDLWLDREAGVAVDAAQAGNEARFVNDYRGVRDRPNAEFRECWDTRRGEKCMAVFVLPAGKNVGKKAVGGIAKGEEICVSYGKGFWGKRQAEGDEYGMAVENGECEI